VISSSALSDRRGLWAFVLGVLLVTAGVVAHLPMFLMGRMTHYRLYGMPMGSEMVAGMGAIILGIAVAAYGLLPKNISSQLAASQDIVVSPPEDAPLSRAHWVLMSVLVIALVIDIMKPASLGFTIPGMVSEYGVPKATASLVPFFALTGTVVGSVIWGIIADVYGRKLTKSGPVFREATFTGRKAVLKFDQAGDGLRIRDGDKLDEFAIAGVDGKWYWANARIVSKDRIEVWSDAVLEPVAVRYAFNNNPRHPNLTNNSGLPAAPFRTDRWPGPTDGKR